MRFARLVLPLALALLAVTPALARVAAIETTAPLTDQSDESIRAAIRQAVLTAVRGAMAMGFQWVQVRQALVYTDLVSVKVLASDREPEGDQDPAPEEEIGTPGPARVDI